jgi:hypothetical protein
LHHLGVVVGTDQRREIAQAGKGVGTAKRNKDNARIQSFDLGEGSAVGTQQIRAVVTDKDFEGGGDDNDARTAGKVEALGNFAVGRSQRPIHRFHLVHRLLRDW